MLPTLPGVLASVFFEQKATKAMKNSEKLNVERRVDFQSAYQVAD